MEVSERQHHILEFIEEFLGKNGYPPSVREIGAAVGISAPSGVHHHLKILKERGYIQRGEGISRGLRLTAGARRPNIIHLPLLGRIAAGEPLPMPGQDRPLESYEALELTRTIIPQEEGLYALEVKGTSMIDALINDGDIVVMRHQREAQNGEMVAAWLKREQETTLKRFYLDEKMGLVRLEPENPTMKPIFVHLSNVEIQGKVIAVIRRLK